MSRSDRRISATAVDQKPVQGGVTSGSRMKAPSADKKRKHGEHKHWGLQFLLENEAESLPHISLLVEMHKSAEPIPSLKEIFERFATFGAAGSKHEIDNARFVKLCRDSQLISKGLTTTDLDLIFNRSKEKGARRLNYQQFAEHALPEIAAKRMQTTEEISQLCIDCGGPVSQCTAADTNNRFFNGGSATPQRSRTNTPQARTPKPEPAPGVHVNNEPELKNVFEAFASFGTQHQSEIDSSKFAKMLKEANIISKTFTTTQADLIFNKNKLKKARKLTFEQFKNAMVEIADKVSLSTDGLGEAIIQTGGPVAKATTVAENVRFYDSKNGKGGNSRSPSKGTGKTMVESQFPFLAKLQSLPKEEENTEGTALGSALTRAAEIKAEEQVTNERSASRKRAENTSPPVEEESVSPPKRRTSEVQGSIEDFRRETAKLRKQRREAEAEKQQKEMEKMSEYRRQRQLQDDQHRKEREEQLRQRLEQLRLRREARELEFLVGERRALQVLRSKTYMEEIQEKYEQRERLEELRREAVLAERKAVFHQPVVVGLEEAERKLKEVEERNKARGDQIRQQLKDVSSQKRSYHQGPTYDQAVQEYMRNRHVFDDARHQQLYKHAKMNEYGKLVKQIPHEETPVPIRTSYTPQPDNRPPPHIAKESASIADRNKAGNQYLREVIKEKPRLPPGLKLQPIKERELIDKELKQLKERKKLGDAYLRELAQGVTKPEGLDSSKHGNDDELLTELRRARNRALHLENRWAEERRRDPQLKKANPEEEVAVAEDFLGVVKSKLELLQQLEKVDAPSKKRKL